MSQTINVQMDLDDTGFKEVSLEEAKSLVAKSHARGMIVLNKRRGHVIREITPEVKEIIIMELMDGG